MRSLLTLATPPVKSGLYHFLGGKSAMDIRHYQNACHWLAYLGSRFVAMSVLLLSFLGSAFAADHAVILMYHRFGETVCQAQISALINLMRISKNYQMAITRSGRLAKIVDHLQKDMPLPDRTVAITIDDAYLSVFTEAWPRLQAKGFPFTVFVATDPVDRKNRGYMSWDQLRQLQADGVGIGSQTASHPHMHLSSPCRC
jgi:hypothetical protein